MKVTLSCKSTGEKKEVWKIFQNYVLYFGYKCDRRPFQHNKGTRKETKISRISCLIKGILLVIFISKKKRKYCNLQAEEFSKNVMELNDIDFINAPYIKLYSLTL